MTFADKMRQLFHPEERWPHWAVHLYRKMEEIMAVTDDIRAAVDSVHTILSEVNIYATDTQARLDALSAQIDALDDNAADPAVVEELKTAIAELRSKADSLVAIVPNPPADVQPETPAEPPAEAPVE